MQVRVLLYAAFRETVGANKIEVEVPEGTTLIGVFSEVQRQYPRLERLLPYTQFARNREVADSDTVVTEGDEVVFLQPASGGIQ
jgi:molybdopterin synthase sulfur carrier subunit